jgi:hypothetical protein
MGQQVVYGLLRCKLHENTLGTIKIQYPHLPMKEKTSLQVDSTHWLQDFFCLLMLFAIFGVL